MFEAACVALGEIGDALGCDPNEGGSEPILDAIEELRSKLAAREADILDLSAQFRAKLDPLQAKLSKLEGQEPVMVYEGRCIIDCGDGGHQNVTMLKMIAAGSKLYAAAGAAPESTKTVDRAWSQFCGGIGRGSTAPYPGMIEAFEAHYGQSFTDKDWHNETGIWAAAWGYAVRQSATSRPVEFHTKDAQHENTNSTP